MDEVSNAESSQKCLEDIDRSLSKCQLLQNQIKEELVSTRECIKYSKKNMDAGRRMISADIKELTGMIKLLSVLNKELESRKALNLDTAAYKL